MQLWNLKHFHLSNSVETCKIQNERYGVELIWFVSFYLGKTEVMRSSHNYFKNDKYNNLDALSLWAIYLSYVPATPKEGTLF